MSDEIQRNTIIIALDNLISDISFSLEDKDNPDREYLEFLLTSAASILKEMADSDPKIPLSKPQWENLTDP